MIHCYIEKLIVESWLIRFACSKEKDIGALQQSMDEQASEIASLQRRVRELEARIEELEEDLESERNNKSRVSWGLTKLLIQ